MDLIEGRNAVFEALRANVPLKRISIAAGSKPDRSLSEIEQHAAAAGVEVRHVKRSQLDAMSERGTHQGVMAEAQPYRFTPLSEVIARAADKPRSLIIALDHVTDPHNLGAVARTAEVVGADAVLITKRRSAPVTAAAYKASAGAVAHIPIVQETNLVRAIETLKAERYWVGGASERAEQTVWEAPLEGRVVLVMGSEGSGLSRLALESCDFLIRLPQAGKVGSLNVAQATTAIAYEWLRRAEASSR